VATGDGWAAGIGANGVAVGAIGVRPVHAIADSTTSPIPASHIRNLSKSLIVCLFTIPCL